MEDQRVQQLDKISMKSGHGDILSLFNTVVFPTVQYTKEGRQRGQGEAVMRSNLNENRSYRMTEVFLGAVALMQLIQIYSMAYSIHVIKAPYCHLQSFT